MELLRKLKKMSMGHSKNRSASLPALPVEMTRPDNGANNGNKASGRKNATTQTNRRSKNSNGTNDPGKQGGNNDRKINATIETNKLRRNNSNEDGKRAQQNDETARLKKLITERKKLDGKREYLKQDMQNAIGKSMKNNRKRGNSKSEQNKLILLKDLRSPSQHGFSNAVERVGFLPNNLQIIRGIIQKDRETVRSINQQNNTIRKLSYKNKATLKRLINEDRRESRPYYHGVYPTLFYENTPSEIERRVDSVLRAGTTALNQQIERERRKAEF